MRKVSDEVQPHSTVATYFISSSLKEAVWNQQDMVHIAQDRELGATGDLAESETMAGKLTMGLGANWIDLNGNSNFGGHGDNSEIGAVLKAKNNIRSDAGSSTTADGRTESALVLVIARSDGGARSERPVRYQIHDFRSQVKTCSDDYCQHSGGARELDFTI
jgi:hypothetical protein